MSDTYTTNTIDVFIQRCIQSEKQFKYTIADLKPFFGNNAGDYMETWMKIRKAIEFGKNDVPLSEEHIVEFFSTPLSKERMNKLCEQYKITPKEAGDSKGDIFFGGKAFSFKFTGKGHPSIANSTARSLFLENPDLAPYDTRLTALFKSWFDRFPTKTLYPFTIINNEEDKNMLREIVIYFCSKGTAKGLSTIAADQMFVVLDPLHADSWFVGSPATFVDTFWDSMSIEFRSDDRNAHSLTVAKIKKINIDLEWHDPHRDENSKPYYLIGVRLGKRKRDKHETELISHQAKHFVKYHDNDKDKDKDKHTELRQLKCDKDAQLRQLTEQSETITLPMSVSSHNGLVIGTLSNRWHLRNQAYEITLLPKKIAISSNLTEATSTIKQMEQVAQLCELFGIAQSALKMLLEEDTSQPRNESLNQNLAILARQFSVCLFQR